MKSHSRIILAAVTAAVLALSLAGFAADGKKTDKPKPYPLDTCVTDGEKLGSMGKSYVFVHEGREIKLCCKACLGDFQKDSAKFVKKLEDAEKKRAK